MEEVSNSCPSPWSAPSHRPDRAPPRDWKAKTRHWGPSWFVPTSPRQGMEQGARHRKWLWDGMLAKRARPAKQKPTEILGSSMPHAPLPVSPSRSPIGGQHQTSTGLDGGLCRIHPRGASWPPKDQASPASFPAPRRGKAVCKLAANEYPKRDTTARTTPSSLPICSLPGRRYTVQPRACTSGISARDARTPRPAITIDGTWRVDASMRLAPVADRFPTLLR
jgi:hypothetical protein